MTPQSQSTETFPLVPLLVFFAGMTLLLVLVFGIGGSNASAPEVAAAPTKVASATPAGATATPTTIPPRVTPTPQTVTAAELDPQMVSAGETVFQGLCAACHGFNARGIQGLGKPLVESDYINGLSNEELHTLIITGRAIDDPLNTTGMVMPPKGGNPSLSDADIDNVVAYIRSLNGAPSAVVEATTIPTDSGPRPTATEFVAPSLSNLLGSSDEATAEATQEIAPAPTQAAPSPTAIPILSGGQADYVRSCAGCHGVNGEGVAFTGSSLVDNELVQTHNGMAIINLLTAKHPPIDPREAYPHPYRGGYPELTDQQIADIVVYLYTLMQ